MPTDGWPYIHNVAKLIRKASRRCGRGGRSAPVDNLDRCCLEHEMCYGRTVRECPDVWKKPYNMMYAWTPLDEEVVCGRCSRCCCLT